MKDYGFTSDFFSYVQHLFPHEPPLSGISQPPSGGKEAQGGCWAKKDSERRILKGLKC